MEQDVAGRFVARPVAERFWEKVDKTGDCWIWTSVLTKSGYGHFKAKIGGVHRYVRAHRWAWEETRGPIPTDLTVDHLCGHPACVNPEHLELVTVAENIRRGNPDWKQKAARTHCAHGHPFSDANTYWYGNTRQCRICRAAAGRRRRQRTL